VPKKYQAIESIKVARAMVAYSQQPQSGIFVHESHELQNFMIAVIQRAPKPLSPLTEL